MKRTVLIVFIALVSTAALFADEAPPPAKAKPVKAKIQILIDPEAKDSKIVISRETLEALLDPENAGPVGLSGVSRSQTIFGGLLLSASFIFGGIWLSRRKEGHGIAPAAGAVVAVICGMAVLAMGNAAPPVFQRIDSKLFSDGMKAQKYAHGEIMVELSPDSYFDGIELIVAPEKKPGKQAAKNE